MIRKILLLVSVMGLAGCASSPLRMTDVKEGNWKAKSLIKDKEQSRSYIVYLDFNAVRGEKSRMDVTNALGAGVAALVADNKEVRYVLIQSKRYYYGAPQSNVMQPILSVPFDPRWLQNILFDIPFTDKNWSCTTDSNGIVKNCSNSATNLKVAWGARQGDKKTISIEHPRALVQINIQSFKPKVEDRKNLFVLEAPEGFQKLRVR
jgi:hypothetical protein